MSPKYRRRSAVVEAIQFTGGNKQEVIMFADKMLKEYSNKCTLTYQEDRNAFLVQCLDIDTWLYPGNYLVKGSSGGLFPCQRGIFEASYEPIK